MTDDASPQLLAAMQAINDNAARLMAQIDDGQWDQPTPCSEWAVRDLVLHMVNTTQFFQACAGRSEPLPPVEASAVEADPAALFGGIAEATMKAWHGPGATEGDVTVPAPMPAVAALGINVLDTGTHCWDLATAIGAEHGLTDEQVALIDRCSRQTVNDEIRAGAGFGPDLDDGSATGLTSTLAFLGRRG